MVLQGNEVTPAASAFVTIISNIIGIMTIIAGIYFIFQFIIGGYGYMTASGDPKKMSEATKKITSAFIGLLVVVAAYAIIHLLGVILGFEILDPQNIIERLRPGG
jgi:Trk-type K+ transport system membrane component